MSELSELNSSIRRTTLVEIIGLTLVLALAVYLRFANLSAVPSLHSDEGTILELAINFADGKMEYFAIGDSTILVARPPLFFAMVSFLLPFFADPLLALRSLSAALGVLSVALLFALVRGALGRESRDLALMAALMLAIYPGAVLFSRIGFSYNLLAALVLIATLALWRYATSKDPRYLLLGSLAIGLGMISDILAIVYAVPLVLLVVVIRWRDLMIALAGLFTFPLGYAFFMMITNREAFLFDALFTLQRTAALGLAAQIGVMITNFSLLITGSAWFVVGVIGLFLLLPNHWRWLILGMFLLPLFSVARTVGLVGLGEYFLIPFFPFLALGLAQFILKGAPVLASTIHGASTRFLSPFALETETSRWISRRGRALSVAIVVFMLLLLPMLFSTIRQIVALQGGLGDHLSWAMVDIGDAQEAARYVNERAAEDQLAIGSPAVLWMLDNNKADFQQAAAFQGMDTMHLPGDIPEDRFLLNPSLAEARFVIVDNLWRNWAAPGNDELARMLAAIQEWPLSFANGQVFIYENPSLVIEDE